MKIKQREVELKDGSLCIIRSPEKNDAAALIEYLTEIAKESEFILRTPQDPVPTMEQEIKIIQEKLDSPNKALICAFVDGKLIASASLEGGSKRKTAHRANLGIAVRKQWWGKRVGAYLMEEMEKVAKAFGATQLELQYLDGNDRGIALYRKCGFVEVGRIPFGFLLSDNSFRDEVFMLKFLTKEE
jgi:RimJ/RimL family protein N-acetyltransferase